MIPGGTLEKGETIRTQERRRQRIHPFNVARKLPACLRSLRPGLLLRILLHLGAGAAVPENVQEVLCAALGHKSKTCKVKVYRKGEERGRVMKKKTAVIGQARKSKPKSKETRTSEVALVNEDVAEKAGILVDVASLINRWAFRLTSKALSNQARMMRSPAIQRIPKEGEESLPQGVRRTLIQQGNGRQGHDCDKG